MGDSENCKIGMSEADNERPYEGRIQRSKMYPSLGAADEETKASTLNKSVFQHTSVEGVEKDKSEDEDVEDASDSSDHSASEDCDDESRSLEQSDIKTSPNAAKNAKKVRQKHRPVFSKRATSILRAWMFDPEHVLCPYPTLEEKKKLSQATGIEVKQITNWFANQRKRIWHPAHRNASGISETPRGRTVKYTLYEQLQKQGDEGKFLQGLFPSMKREAREGEQEQEIPRLPLSGHSWRRETPPMSYKEEIPLFRPSRVNVVTPRTSEIYWRQGEAEPWSESEAGSSRLHPQSQHHWTTQAQAYRQRIDPREFDRAYGSPQEGDRLGRRWNSPGNSYTYPHPAWSMSRQVPRSDGSMSETYAQQRSYPPVARMHPYYTHVTTHRNGDLRVYDRSLHHERTKYSHYSHNVNTHFRDPRGLPRSSQPWHDDRSRRHPDYSHNRRNESNEQALPQYFPG